MRKKITYKDIEKISAYADGALSRKERMQIESRLATDAALRDMLEEIRRTRSVLRHAPKRRAPRHFRLTPQMAGVKPPLPRVFPALRLATMLATAFLLFAFTTNAIAPRLVAPQYASPLFAIGGGVTEEQASADQSAPMMAMTTEEITPNAAEALPEKTAEEQPNLSGAETIDTARMIPEALDQSAQPFSPGILFLLGGLAAALGALTAITAWLPAWRWRRKNR